METHSKDSGAAWLAGRSSPLRAEIAELLTDLLTDIVMDVEVVGRELNLRDETRERLRRALGRLDCAQAVSRSMGAMAAGIEEEAMQGIRDAVKLLAGDWPQDYPEEAVLWRILGEVKQSVG